MFAVHMLIVISKNLLFLNIILGISFFYSLCSIQGCQFIFILLWINKVKEEQTDFNSRNQLEIFSNENSVWTHEVTKWICFSLIWVVKLSWKMFYFFIKLFESLFNVVELFLILILLASIASINSREYSY